MSAAHWLGPYNNADDALNELRKSVAEIIGEDPETWPDHGNAPLAIAATLALARRTNPAPAQEPVAVPAGDEIGWLIELKAQRPTWWCLGWDEEPGWSTDASKALRFARRVDAEAYIEDIGWTDAFASEHIWTAPEPCPNSRKQTVNCSPPGAS